MLRGQLWIGRSDNGASFAGLGASEVSKPQYLGLGVIGDFEVEWKRLMECLKKTELRNAYLAAIEGFTKNGGYDPQRVLDAELIEQKGKLDRAAAELIEHREVHGC